MVEDPPIEIYLENPGPLYIACERPTGVIGNRVFISSPEDPHSPTLAAVDRSLKVVSPITLHIFLIKARLVRVIKPFLDIFPDRAGLGDDRAQELLAEGLGKTITYLFPYQIQPPSSIPLFCLQEGNSQTSHFDITQSGFYLARTKTPLVTASKLLLKK